MSDWTVKIEHPNGRVVTPAMLDNPQFLPNPNGKPELTIPISKDTAWLREEWDNAPVRAYNDGKRVPVERLVEQSLTNGHIELVAEGGVELDETVDVEIGEEFSHIAFGDIVSEHTPYSVDIDDPGEQLSEGQLLALINTEAGWLDFDRGDIDDTIPLEITESGELITHETTGYVEAENADSVSTVNDPAEEPEYSGGKAERLTGSAEFIEHSFTIPYEVPADEFAIVDRFETIGDVDPGMDIEWKLDGTVIDSINVGGGFSLSWRESGPADFSVGPGTVNIQIDRTSVQDDDEEYRVDGLGWADLRFNDPGEFDNEVHEPNGYLDDPPQYPDAITAEFGDAISLFSIVNGHLSVDIDNTDNGQKLELSGDLGDTWYEAQNSDSLSVDFDEPTTTLRTRLTLSNHSPQGPRDQTPRLGYAGQTVSELEIRADVDESPLTVDYSNEDSVETILNDIAGQGFIWEFTYQNDEPTISLTQPGDRVAIGTPDIVDLSVTKDTHTYQKVSVRGANRSVRDEAFSASDTFEDLNRANIIPGTETVRSDDGETFDRGEDYTMAWTDGQIRRLSDSDMVQGETYRIDYDFEVRGSFALDGVDEPKELVTDLPGVVAERSAELVAQQLVQIVSEPQWSGEATIPARESLFSGIEALNLAIKDADLPDSAMPLVPSDRVDVGPQGIVYTLGSGPDIAEVISDVRSRTASISKRV